MFDQIENNNLN